MTDNNIEERIFFNEGQFQITDKRAVLGSKTYSIANITSVSTVEVKPLTCFPTVLIILGAISLLVYLSFLLSSENVFSLLVFGLMMSGLGFFWIRSMGGSKYVIKIESASGEFDGMSSNDQELISRIVIAMNDAIIMR